jgi:dienelactone hydrolase
MKSAARIIVCTLLSATINAQTPSTNRLQPAIPGTEAIAARHKHAAVELVALGEGMHRVYIFLPAQPSVIGQAPVVFFEHGWQGMNPKNYGALIDHLAREGNVVIYPVYQEDNDTSPQIVTAAAAEAESNALAELRRRGVEINPQRVVYFGYSMGAAIALNLAAHAEAEHLPAAQALVLAAPGDAYHVAQGEKAKSIWPNLKELPSTLPIAIVTGLDDYAIGLPTGRKLAAALCSVTKPDRRVLLVLPADQHAGSKVSSGHGGPGAPDSRYDMELATPRAALPKIIAGRVGFEPSISLNQLDFFGFWRVLDAVIDSLAAAPSISSHYVPPAEVFVSSTPAQTYLGTWADGTPYKPATVENPCAAK